MYSHVIYSDDHGRSWRLGGIAPEKHVNECEVAELSDGRLMLNMRNYDRRTPARQIALSDDGGQSWRDQRHDATLIEPRCQASLRRFAWPQVGQPGLLLFSNPASPDRRINMTVRGSQDDGATWPLGLTLYPGSSAYSCLVALAGDSAGCLYEADDYGRIVFARFLVSELRRSAQNAAGP
jgi:sialidase-1